MNEMMKTETMKIVYLFEYMAIVPRHPRKKKQKNTKLPKLRQLEVARFHTIVEKCTCRDADAVSRVRV